MDTEVIRISINDNEKIVELLKRMIELKNLEHKDVECEFNGTLLTTLNSNNIQELMVNNSNAIFEEFEKDRVSLLETPEMQRTIENFEDRGTDEFDTQEEADAISKLEDEFDHKIKELDTLDFSKSINVYNWLNSLVDYVNNIDLYIPLDRQDYKYGSSANYIVQKLSEKGYTTEKNSIENLDDYYRRLISYQLSDLDKYQFFAYDYADKMRDSYEVTEVEDSIQEQSDVLEKLESEKQSILFKLSVVDDYEKGLFNSKRERTPSFEERKKELRTKIEELEKSKNSDVKTDINEDFLKANDKLRQLVMRTYSEEIKAVKFYEAAAGVPFPNNIIPALEQAALLPDSNELKQPLIDALVKMDARYSSFKDEQDAKLVQDTMSRLGIKPYNPFASIDEEIIKLEQNIKAIEKEQSQRIENEKSIRDMLNTQLEQIDLQINQEKNLSNEEIVESSIDEPEEMSFQDKLASIAEEGPIAVDLERRLDQKDQWMELNTAKYLDKINDDETQTVKEDSLTMPHPIKAIKKASITLIEKVNSLDFNNIKMKVLNYIKEHKKISCAVAVGFMVLAGFGLKTNLDAAQVTETKNFEIESNQDDLQTVDVQKVVVNHQNDMIKNGVNSESDSLDVSVVSAEENQLSMSEEKVESTESEKTAAELTQEAIQEAIDGVMNGDKVYDDKYDAIHNENGLSTSESHRENSWANSEVGAFYNSDAKVLTREEAEAIIANGGEVVARFDNNGTPIGYTSVGQLSNDDASGLSK